MKAWLPLTCAVSPWAAHWFSDPVGAESSSETNLVFGGEVVLNILQDASRELVQ